MAWRKGRDRSGSRGFTLLELLVALSIIALASALVIANIAGIENNMFAAEVRQAESVLNFARRVAIVDAAPKEAIFLTLDLDHPDYEIIREELESRSDMPFWESAEVELEYQADVNALSEGLGRIAVQFFPQGGSTGGILNFSMNELSASIRIDPITGRISTRYAGEEFSEED